MSRKPPRILVVDDDPEWRALMAEVLGTEGFAVDEAGDGVQALELLPQCEPSAIITDLNMPAMNGRQLLQALHQRDPLLPVIVATSERPEGHAPEVPGAFRVLEKTIPLEGLLSTVSEASKVTAATTKVTAVERRTSKLPALHSIFTLAARSPALTRAVVVAAVVVTSAAVFNRLRPFG